MSELATLRAEREGAVVLVVVEGEVDPSNARVLGRKATEAVPNEALGVVLDLSLVEYLDSSGVQMVFELAERLEARQQRLVVCVPEGAPARRVLDIVAIDATAPLLASCDEAVARLSAQPH
jgi:anti-anti-sigma factor